jgi:hypothetical protein
MPNSRSQGASFHPARIVMRRVRQGLYAVSGLLAAGILTETFAARWGSIGLIAVCLGTLVLACIGVLAEIVEKQFFPEEYHD